MATSKLSVHGIFVKIGVIVVSLNQQMSSLRNPLPQSGIKERKRREGGQRNEPSLHVTSSFWYVAGY